MVSLKTGLRPGQSSETMRGLNVLLGIAERKELTLMTILGQDGWNISDTLVRFTVEMLQYFLNFKNWICLNNYIDYIGFI